MGIGRSLQLRVTCRPTRPQALTARWQRFGVRVTWHAKLPARGTPAANLRLIKMTPCRANARRRAGGRWPQSARRLLGRGCAFFPNEANQLACGPAKGRDREWRWAMKGLHAMSSTVG